MYAQDKSVTVSAAAANNYRVTAPSDETLTIADDDTASTEVTLTVAPYEVNENGAAAKTLDGDRDAGRGDADHGHGGDAGGGERGRRRALTTRRPGRR